MHPRSQDRKKDVLDNTCEITLHIVESYKVLGIFIWNYYISYAFRNLMLNFSGRPMHRILELERT